jgi:hypothetical protein
VLEITLAEHERVRANGARFVVRDGQQLGPAGTIARASDPHQHAQRDAERRDVTRSRRRRRRSERPAAQPGEAVVSLHAQTDARAQNVFADPPPPAQLQAPTEQPRPTLLFFYSPTSGSSRRVEAFLAQVLQRRRNHETFTIRRIDYDANAGLAGRLGVRQPPAIVVVEAKRLRARLERPRGCTDIHATLAPWLK